MEVPVKNEYHVALYSDLFRRIHEFSVEMATKYGGQSPFFAASFRIDYDGLHFIFEPTKSGRVGGILAYGPRRNIHCTLGITDSTGRLTKSNVEVRSLDELADWLELQGDPVG
jgi:hypothetical protein